jgi:hypothetical protein
MVKYTIQKRLDKGIFKRRYVYVIYKKNNSIPIRVYKNKSDAKNFQKNGRD